MKSGEQKMGSLIKFVSGIILFVIGFLIAYESTLYSFLNMLLFVGFLMCIVGIILIISYFVDLNAEKTSNIIKNFLESKDSDSDTLKKPVNGNNDFNNNGPLIMREKSDDDYDYGANIDDSGLWEYYESEKNNELTPKQFFDSPEIDESKAVLNVVKKEEKDVDFDKKLEFTPNYDKPIKVTRKPKKRSDKHIPSEISQNDEKVPVDKTEEIKKALNIENTEEPDVRDIEIDINNPERLPVPNSLKGNILLDNSVLSSNDAFEQLAIGVNKEIMLEIPSLNTLSDRFLSHVPTIYSRVIINEFDLSDISYTVLVASLLKQGVHIRTIPKVHAINLITDDSYAMIISDNDKNSEYGAIYDDRISISNIRSDFERTWNIASNLDENVIINSISGRVA